MTNAEYHARAEISKSDLDLLAKSPYLLKLKKDGKYQSEATPSQILGSAVHKLLLERNDFINEFAIEPNIDKRTKDGKAEYNEFLAKNSHKIIIKADEFEKADLIARSVLEMQGTANFLKDGKAEQSYFGEIDGVKVKCRPDFYNENLGLIIDLKTTSDASPNGFLKSVANFNYDMQVAFYSDILQSLGKKVNSFLFIAVETKEPYLVSFYEIKPNTNIYQSGRELYQKLLKKWRWCLEKDFYPSYEKIGDNGEIEVIHQLTDLPTYEIYKRIENF